MTRQSVSCIMVVPALLLAVAVAVSDAQQKGRYKKQGANCEWDANDTGPNQCTPARVRPLEEGRRRVHVERQRLRSRSVQPAPGAVAIPATTPEWYRNDSGVVRLLLRSGTARTPE